MYVGNPGPKEVDQQMVKQYNLNSKNSMPNLPSVIILIIIIIIIIISV